MLARVHFRLEQRQDYDIPNSDFEIFLYEPLLYDINIQATAKYSKY